MKKLLTGLFVVVMLMSAQSTSAQTSSTYKTYKLLSGVRTERKYSDTVDEISGQAPAPIVTNKTIYLPATFKLTKGTVGNEVIDLQIQLALLGYYNGNFDGKFGPMLKNSVVLFQKYNNLLPDGIAGIKTQQKIVDVVFSKKDQPVTISDQRVIQIGTKLSEIARIKLGETMTPEDKVEMDNFMNDPQLKKATDTFSIYMTYINEYLLEVQKDPSLTEKKSFSTGESSAIIKLFKYQLKELGYFSGSITRDFNKELETSIKKVQKDQNLDQTGKLDEKTMVVISDLTQEKIFKK